LAVEGSCFDAKEKWSAWQNSEVGSTGLTTPSSTKRPAAAFPEGAEELDLIADEAALAEDIVYPGQQSWLNRE